MTLSRTHALPGASLTAGALVWVVAIVLYVVVYGQPTGTGPGGAVTVADSAAHVAANWDLVAGIWFAELVAAILVALAGFSLQTAPGGLAWSAVGVGATILAVMYALCLGGCPPALAAFDDDPAAFATIRGAATTLFHVGTGVVFAGLAGAFFRHPGLRRWVALTGAVICAVAALQSLAVLAGIEALAVASPFALVALLLAGLLGIAQWRVARAL